MSEGIKISPPDQLDAFLNADTGSILNLLKELLVDITAGAAGGGLTGGPLGAGIGAAAGVISSRGNFSKIRNALQTQDASVQGWMLCHTSMVLAVTQILLDLESRFPDHLTPAINELTTGIESALQNSEVEIGPDFFRDPAPEFSKIIQHRLRNALKKTKHSEAIIGQLASQIPSAFASSLRYEFLVHQNAYAKLLKETSTPFDSAFQRRLQWYEYSDWLNSRRAESMFDEAFCLEDVYVPLRCYWNQEKNDSGTESEPVETRRNFNERNSENRVRQVHQLDDYLDHWLEELKNNYPEDDSQRVKSALRIITGGPGSGKSTTVRRFAARMWEAGKDFYSVYIPLHLFDFTDSIENALNKFCEYHEPRLPGDLLSRDATEKNLLLIFDGLDELAKQGEIGAEAAKSFAEYLVTWLGNYGGKRRLCVLLCGRPVAADRAFVRGMETEQTLHLISYNERFSKLEDDRYIDTQKLLEEDQREIWWRKYQTAKKIPQQGMPSELKDRGPELDDLTSQPLLNYLVALTYERAQAGENCIDFSKQININTIYADMLKAIWDQQHASLKEIQFEQFQCLLEDIAISAWHGSGRATSLASVEQHLSKVQKIHLQELSGVVSKGIMRLFLSFYIQARQIAAGEEVFEFTHKSFGEYLAARRMTATMTFCHDEYQRGQAGPRAGGMGIRECLVEWAKNFGPTRLDHDINRFLRGELACHDVNGKLFYNTEQLQSWRRLLVQMINSVLQAGMPMERLSIPTFHEQNRQSIAAEEALMAMHANISEGLSSRGIEVSPSHIEWPEKTSFGTWHKRIVQQRLGNYTSVFQQSLSFLESENQVMEFVDLSRANLTGANLTGAYLHSANLLVANLTGANLSRTHLSRTNLNGADLSGADLSGADLTDAKLRRANLKGANLPGANLNGADLSGANLPGANLSGANLRRANLIDANFSDMQLIQTIGTPRKLPDGSIPSEDFRESL